MYLDKAKKEEIFSKYGKSNSDTGSAESQIALFSYRIAHLTEHVKKNRKDYTTTRALTQLVGKRRALLDYLYDRDINRYRAIISVFASNQQKQTHCLTELKIPSLARTMGFFFLYQLIKIATYCAEIGKLRNSTY